MTALPTSNTIVPQTFTPAVVMPTQPSRQAPLLPRNMTEAMALADFMATSKLVGSHLQRSPADCLAVILQSVRWGTDPFATAQATSVIQGKLMFEGKLVMAVANTSGRLRGRLNFEYSGEGDARVVTCSGHLIGEPAPVSVDVKLRDARTNNVQWTKQPDQQLAYHSARVWCRRYAPELMLGIYSAEEFDVPAQGPAETPRESIQRTVAETKPPIIVKSPGGGSIEFARSRRGLDEALKLMATDPAGYVMLNLPLLDRCAELPDLADAVADLRQGAAEILNGKTGNPGEIADEDFDAAEG